MTTKNVTEGLVLPTTTYEDLKRLPLSTLRSYRTLLTEEEEKVSYWRRLIQFRLNLIKAEKEADHISTRDLAKALGSTGSGHRRQQLLSVDEKDELPQLPGLDDLWTAAIDPADEEATRALVAELNSAERTLSDYRRSLHQRIDAATAELISRYKADPNLCLDLFPKHAR